MDYRDKTKRLEYLKELILKEQATSASDIAMKFGCCERTIRRMIMKLRNEGYPIIYSKKIQKYFLEKR